MWGFVSIYERFWGRGGDQSYATPAHRVSRQVSKNHEEHTLIRKSRCHPGIDLGLNDRGSMVLLALPFLTGQTQLPSPPLLLSIWKCHSLLQVPFSLSPHSVLSPPRWKVAPANSDSGTRSHTRSYLLPSPQPHYFITTRNRESWCCPIVHCCRSQCYHRTSLGNYLRIMLYSVFTVHESTRLVVFLGTKRTLFYIYIYIHTCFFYQWICWVLIKWIRA